MTDFSRNELIWGKENQKKLKNKHVTVFGLGGVGGLPLNHLPVPVLKILRSWILTLFPLPI